MKIFVTFALSLIVFTGFASYADAQSYYSQRARQDREYKSLSNATQRAYGTNNSSSTTRSNSYRR